MASTQQPDAELAAAELSAALPSDARGVIFFCSSGYDLGRLGPALAARFRCPVAGCTSAGQIGPTGYQKEGITALALGGATELSVHRFEMNGSVRRAADAIGARVAAAGPSQHTFALVMLDGLSMREERVIAELYGALGDVPIIGGSAADNLAFARTSVYFGGRFESGIGVAVLVTTSAPVRVFKVEHFKPSARRLVVTRADPSARVIHELNGFPAAFAYAEALGLPEAELDQAFATHPLILRLGGASFVRSPRERLNDGSIAMYCAIEEGEVLSVADREDALPVLSKALCQARSAVGEDAVVLGCDCVLRRLQFEKEGIDAAVGRVLASHRVVGFSTYGEQFNGTHINQTLTAVALGS